MRAEPRTSWAMEGESRPTPTSLQALWKSGWMDRTSEKKIGLLIQEKGKGRTTNVWVQWGTNDEIALICMNMC